MPIIDSILAEFDHELPVTLRVLERVPFDKLTWTPHPKSKPVGNLAWHIATLPARVQTMLTDGDFDVTAGRPMPMPDQPGAIAAGLTAHAEQLRASLAAMDESALKDTFTMRAGQKILNRMPKIAVIRNILFNHTYHHRGQLTVYLRMLDIPVPAVYGASADENPFA